ncbi:MAG: class I SAM-dependent methyltransferase [Bryobacterales bacterium]|nr:class I SAM-dependent methyltransferase [Bryobacterales bacterium]
MATDFFTKELSESYDERNANLSPIVENAHFLISLVLKQLPVDARVLCIGAGTGAEILSLAKAYPGFTFLGVDPSEPMLDVCRKRLEAEGIMDRCELIHGYANDVPGDEAFDAVLSVMVGHFVELGQRHEFYRSMVSRLKSGGCVVNCEISFDLDSPEFPQMLENWKQVQSLMGASAESLANLSDMLRSPLAVLPPSEVENHIRECGMQPVRFLQCFMIFGWYGTKT